MEQHAPPSARTLERYLAGECTPSEHEAVRAWLAADPQRSAQLEQLRRSVALDATRGAWDTAGAWTRMQQRIADADIDAEASPPAATRRPRVTTNAPRQWLAGHRRAAAILVAALGAAAARAAYHARADSMIAVVTLSGEQKTIHLGDGSLVRLGPASTLRYRLTSGSRTLELEGLADFVVAHDASRRFVVRAGNATTTDIGTEFVVRAYPGSAVDVAVASGRVALAASASGTPLSTGAAAVTIGAGQAARVAPDGVIRQYASRDDDVSGWLAGRLAFREASVTEVAAELSRWYDVDVSVADSALARRRVSATYASPTLHGVLDALTVSLGARYEQRGRTIVVRSR